MSTVVLFIELLLVHFATQSLTQIQADCNGNISLQCTGIEDMSFHSVAWFKFINQNRTVIVRKRGNKTQYYNFYRTAMFGEQHSLFLPRLTPGDSGSYECAIRANVGGKNVNSSQVILTVPDCQAYLTTVADKLNATHTNPPCSKCVEDLPVMWSIIGYLGVGLFKIALSLIAIWVVRAIKSSRQKQQRWPS